MKIKHLPFVLGGYLVGLAIIFGVIKALNIVMTVGTLVACGAVFVALTAGAVGMSAIAVNNYKQEQLELKQGVAQIEKKSAEDELVDYLKILFDMQKTYKEPMVINVDTALMITRRMVEKLKNLDKLLDSTFSKTDLTYVMYKDSLESVIKSFVGNLRGIQKRVAVFDYTEWNSGERSDIALKYLTDIQNMINQNDMILDRMDTLISELVSLDDVADFSLDNLNSLIQQTQDYKNINND